MKRIHKNRRKASPDFYEAALSEADRAGLAEARGVDGIDEEIALLRLQLRRALQDDPVDAKLLHGGVRLLIHALLLQRRLSRAHADALLESVTGIVEGFVDAVASAPDA
jgi:hypothetical protein